MFIRIKFYFILPTSTYVFQCKSSSFKPVMRVLGSFSSYLALLSNRTISSRSLSIIEVLSLRSSLPVNSLRTLGRTTSCSRLTDDELSSSCRRLTADELTSSYSRLTDDEFSSSWRPLTDDELSSFWRWLNDKSLTSWSSRWICLLVVSARRFCVDWKIWRRFRLW